ncbi:MAG: hypothetical protein K8I30_03880 [Anaerolineae bacterium]|nr:hypothetical protein [Anaerolineae bacterium]
MEKVSQLDCFDGDDMNAVDRLLLHAAHTPPVRQLGGFLDACLSNLGWTPDELARRAAVETVLIEGLLNGSLPDTVVNDALLVKIAQTVGYQPNVLRILLGREFVPTAEPEEPQPAAEVEDDEEFDLSSYLEEYDRLHDQMVEQLLDMLDERHTARRRNRKSQQHEFIVQHIETLIARYRADVRFVEVLAEQIRAPHRDGEHPQRLDIYRIIHYIRDHAD